MPKNRYIDEIETIIQRERFEAARPLAVIIDDLEHILEDLKLAAEQREFYDDFDDEPPDAA